MNKNITILLITAILGLLPLVSVQAQISAELKTAISEATDDAVLIETISKPGETPDDIFIKMLACKKLGRIGTEKAVPALAAMLPNEKLNHAARYALEAMVCPAADEALIKGAKELDGVCGVGCVDSVGAQRLVQAMPMLQEKLKGCDCPLMRKAIYVAFGYFGTDEATAFLMSLLNGAPDKDAAAQRGLGDAIMDCAEGYEKAGAFDKAIALYDALVCPKFPVFMQKAASYHALLVILALGDRKDAVSKNLTFPVLLKYVKSKDVNVQIAAIKALGKVDEKNAVEACKAIGASPVAVDAAERQQILDAIVLACAALPGAGVDDYYMEQYNKMAMKSAPADAAVAYFKVVELRRIDGMGKALVDVANTKGIDDSVRLAALYALADIVTLDKLNLLVEALASETDDNKASWILRSACTRLPREECAAKVVAMFESSSNADEQGKALNLLMQIGGKTALACVEKACWNPATVEAASQILGKWNTPDDIQDVAAACLKLAKDSKENKYAVRGIRSYIRIPRQFDMPTAQKFQMCKTAFDSAKRNEDKVLIFEVFKRIIEVSSAKQAFSYASDPQFAEPAYEAVVAIARKFQGQSSEIRDMLKTIAEQSKTAQTVQDAKAQLERFNVAEKEAPIAILSAIYGAGKQVKDVTDIVKSNFFGKRVINISNYNEAFGDVASGVVKSLTIEVQMKATGEKRTLTFKENEPILLPEK